MNAPIQNEIELPIASYAILEGNEIFICTEKNEFGIIDVSDSYNLKVAYNYEIPFANLLARPVRIEFTNYLLVGVKNGQVGLESSIVRFDTLLLTNTPFNYLDRTRSIALKPNSSLLTSIKSNFKVNLDITKPNDPYIGEF